MRQPHEGFYTKTFWSLVLQGGTGLITTRSPDSVLGYFFAIFWCDYTVYLKTTTNFQGQVFVSF